MEKAISIKAIQIFGTALLAILLILSAGCLGNDDDEEDRDHGAQSVGGDGWGDYYNDENEDPGFGDPEIQNMGEDEPYDDPFDNQVQTASVEDAIYIRVLWGNLILDDDDWHNPKDYSGSITIDEGLLVIERTVRFEDYDCEIDNRVEPTLVSWRSRIGPHYDGLVLRLEPGATDDNDNFLHLEIGTYKKVFSVTELMDLVTLDASGYDDDQVAIASHYNVAAGNGFVVGHWRDLPQAGGGIFKGKWETGDGALLGHELARYVPQDNGTGIVKGKYIDTTGQFMGFLYGTYEDTHETLQAGEFDLHWIDRDKTKLGSIEGIYFKRDDAGYGFALGNWIAE